jgi:hypothetical protein
LLNTETTTALPISEEKSTSSISLINPSQIFSLNFTGSKLNSLFDTYTGDLSSCLANCSNQGICILNSDQQFICQCNLFKTGTACQNDLRPCSSGPCLNGGICSDTNNGTTFQCTCKDSTFFGTNCENKLDLCKNSTLCVSDQGYCITNDTRPACKCKIGFSGLKCEIVSSSLAVTKSIVNAATLITFIVFVCLILLIVVFDVSKYYLTKNKKPVRGKKKVVKRFYYNL